MNGYAVIDLETTGMHPDGGDRIVEIAVVQLDSAGAVQEEWETLVNPDRPVTATQIHHITDEDVACAPTMGQLAGTIISLLAGRVLVAHNVSFDVPFLASELRRAGVGLPADPPAVCTLRMARRFLSPRTLRLADCAQAAGIRLCDAHSALGDARAAAALFRHYLHAADDPAPWAAQITAARTYPWPPAPASHARTIRRAR